MGNLFEYIMDSVVISEYISFYDECHVCGSKNRIIFRACGYVSENEPGSELPNVGAGVSAACIHCIKSGKIIPLGEDRFIEFLKENYENWKELKQALRETPQIPSMSHGLDWPVCCGNLTEFSGFPKYQEEFTAFIEEAKYWNRNKNREIHMKRNPHKSLADIFMFQCSKCKKKYWIYQCG